jgi:shikimate kinase
MKQRKSPRVVFLVGFMGAGKSRTGRALARRLGWRFVDLDRRVETRAGRSIARIFREAGEAGFRRAETAELKRLLRELETSPGTVVALGGGAPVRRENRRLLREQQTVFLDVPSGTLWERCRKDRGKRPLVEDEARFLQLYESRRPHYEAAGMQVDAAGRNASELAAEIAGRLGFTRERTAAKREKP